MNQRHINEIQHGHDLLSMGAEMAWGWSTPAGQLRAARRNDLIVQRAQLKSGLTVLEIGCGTGLFTQGFAKSGAEILAIDISENLIEHARRRDYGKSIVRFLGAAFEADEVKNAGPYDAIVGSSVLHHLELQPALERIFDLLAPGGRMAFAEPNMLNPQIFAERTFLRGTLPQVSPDETAFVRWTLARQLRQIGFTQVLIQPYDWLHPAMPQVLIPAVSGLGRILERVPLVREFAGSLIISAYKVS